MPYINVNDAYILDNTGKQVDDAVDYALANSNRNLLDNPWFTVNQRGASGAVASDGYAADRWFVGGASTVTRNADGTITLNGTSSYAVLTQRLEERLINFLVGKTVTMSLLYSDGTVYSGTVDVDANRENVVYINGTTNFFALDTRVSRRWYIYLNGLKKTLTAVKLELGSYSTLVNDVPPDYESEKRKCMAYFQRISLSNSYTSVIGFGLMQDAATNVRINIPTSVPFREGATLSASVGYMGHILIIGNGQSLTATAVTARIAVKTGGVLVDVTVNGNATANQMYAMQFYTYSAYIDISADL